MNQAATLDGIVRSTNSFIQRIEHAATKPRRKQPSSGLSKDKDQDESDMAHTLHSKDNRQSLPVKPSDFLEKYQFN